MLSSDPKGIKSASLGSSVCLDHSDAVKRKIQLKLHLLTRLLKCNVLLLVFGPPDSLNCFRHIISIGPLNSKTRAAIYQSLCCSEKKCFVAYA